MNETTVETIRTDDPFRAAFLMSRKGELILSVRREDSVRFVIKGPELSRQNDLFDSGTVMIHLPHFRNHLLLVEELHRAHLSRLENEWGIAQEPDEADDASDEIVLLDAETEEEETE